MIDLRNGDCLEAMKQIPDGSVDMVLADPPYGTTQCKWDSIIPFEPMWDQLKRVTKKNGAIVMTASQPFTSALIMSNVKMFKYCWVWEKSKASNFMSAKKMPLKNYEDVLVFCFGSTPYFPQFTEGEAYAPRPGKKVTEVYNSTRDHMHRNGSDGKRYPKAIQYFKTSEAEGKVVHPTQKPVALMEYLIKTYTNEGETVLDFTMGSGTTGVAAKNLNRSFIGIELDEAYFNIAKERIENLERPQQ
jgi:site-specific DNA-methyltransferase (adenine-specific)